jgi:hypothetical protein
MADFNLILYILRFLRIFPEFLRKLVSCWRPYCFWHFCCCGSPFCVYVCDVPIVSAIVQPTLAYVKVVSPAPAAASLILLSSLLHVSCRHLLNLNFILVLVDRLLLTFMMCPLYLLLLHPWC